MANYKAKANLTHRGKQIKVGVVFTGLTEAEAESLLARELVEATDEPVDTVETQTPAPTAPAADQPAADTTPASEQAADQTPPADGGAGNNAPLDQSSQPAQPEQPAQPAAGSDTGSQAAADTPAAEQPSPEDIAAAAATQDTQNSK